MNNLLSIWLFILQASPVEMADVLRNNGKIYVVVGVIVLIFIVLFGFLVKIDQKINQLKK